MIMFVLNMILLLFNIGAGVLSQQKTLFWKFGLFNFFLAFYLSSKISQHVQDNQMQF